MFIESWLGKIALATILATGGEKVIRLFKFVKWRIPAETVFTYSVKIKEFKFIKGLYDAKKVVLHYAINYGLTYEELQEIEERLESAFNCEVELVLNKARLIINIYYQHLSFFIEYSDQVFENFTGDCIWPVGLSYKGWIIPDLSSAPHLLIAGITGMGKSATINQALYTNILIHGDSVERIIMDFKDGVEAAKFEGYAKIVDNLNDAAAMLNYLVGELSRRNKILRQQRLEKWQDIPEDERPPYILLVIDEFAELSPELESNKAMKEVKDCIMQKLVTILQKGRAAGMSVVICTQRPDAKVLPGIIKANIPWTIALKVRNDLNSKILLDNTKAAELPLIKGRCIFQTDTEIVCQVPFLSATSIVKRLPKRSAPNVPEQAFPTFDNIEVD